SADLVLVGLAGSALLEAGRDAGLRVAAEAFPDRAYEPDGTLRSRTLAGAVLTDSDAVAERALGMARDGLVIAVDGSRLKLAGSISTKTGRAPARTIEPAVAKKV
ncbi:MAG: hypothetical protein HW385_1122, partial [candidate division NC10 bacterium]|nr:hypothetical protein [candidate division NC10 bacterium]